VVKHRKIKFCDIEPVVPNGLFNCELVLDSEDNVLPVYMIRSESSDNLCMHLTDTPDPDLLHLWRSYHANG
jgi:hypothetical protein